VTDQDGVTPAPSKRFDRITGRHGKFVRSSNYVAIQMAILGGGGFLFWLIAANRFPVADLGRAAALVSITVFVNYLTGLGIPVTVTRFASGRSSEHRTVFSWCIWVTTVASIVGAAVTTAFSSNGFAAELVDQGIIVGFVLMLLSVNSLSLITLVDYRDIALGRPQVVLLRAVVVTVGRVLAVVVMPWSAGPLWIWAAMMLPVPVALLVGAAVDRSGETGFLELRPVPEQPRRIIQFTLTNWVSLLLSQAPFFVLPLIVLASVSTVENANFYLVWTMCASAFLIPQITGRMLLQEAQDNERSFREQARFSLKFTTGIGLVLLALSVPTMLLIERVYGEAYTEAAQILPILFLALLPFAVTMTVLNVARAQERNSATVLVSLSLALCILVPAQLVVGGQGLPGVAAAWLLGHTLSAFLALIVIGPLTRESTEASDRPMTLVGGLLITAAVAVPLLMLGPIGAGVAFAAVAARKMGPRWLAPSVIAALLAVAAAATLLEGRLVATLGFAEDRPVAAAAAGIAMGMLAAWAFLGLSEQAVAAARSECGPELESGSELEPEQASDISAEPAREACVAPASAPAQRVAVTAKFAMLVAGLMGAGVGWVLNPGLSTAAAQLAVQLDDGERVRDATDNLEPLVPLLVSAGPLSAQTLAAAALALIFVAGVRLRTAFDRRDGLVGVGLVALTVWGLRDDLGGLVALGLGLLAVAVAVHADRWVRFCGVCCLLFIGCLASASLLPAAVVVAAAAGRIAERRATRSGGTTVVLTVFVVLAGLQAVRWFGGSIGDALTANPPTAVLFACVLSLPLVLAYRDEAGDGLLSGDGRWGQGQGRGMTEVAAASRRARWYATALLAAIGFGVVLVSQPGSYFADARFEYAFEPERGVRQLNALWQPTTGLGRIAGTEQGPFPILTYWVLRAVGFAPELAQHLWHGLLLAVAAVGAACVVGHFRPRWGIWHVATGLAFAFNPLSLGLFTNSLIFLATIAVAPWMHLAVLNAAQREQRWKWAATLTLCIAASLPTELPGTLFNLGFLLPTAVYVVYVERSCQLRSMVAFVARTALLTTLTVLFVVIRTLRSVGDLSSRLVLSEDPEFVSASTSFSESLRGMGSWLAYFRFGSIVPRPQFAPLIESPFVVAATFMVPICAVVFLVKSDWPPRFLFAALASLSLTVVVGTHPFPLTPWGELVLWLNDNAPATAAFRNTLKAGAPMMLSLAVLFGGLVERTVHARPQRLATSVVGLTWVALFVASSLPAWTLDLYPENRELESVPAYWYEAADWLNEEGQDATGRVLVLPGSTSTAYRWGYVGDDIFTALLSVPHLRQGAFPASTPEAHSLLAALDRSVGDPSYRVDAQLDVLRRLGVRFIVVRNDLDWQALQRARPAQLDPWRESPELARVATFGGLGEFTVDDADDSDESSTERVLPPVEIYELDEWQPIVRAVPAAAPILMSGDGDGWLSLAMKGFLEGSRPLVSTGALSPEALADRFDEGSPLLITDTNALRQLTATSAGLSASSPLQPDSTVRGTYSLYPGEQRQTTSWIPGVDGVESSLESASRPWFRAENAFDGDMRTAWRSGRISQSMQPWLEVEFNELRSVEQVRVRGDQASSGQFATGEVVVSDGTRYPFVFGDDAAVVRLDGDPTESIRVVITGAAGTAEVGIASIEIDDLDLAEHRQVPTDVEMATEAHPDLARAIEGADIGYAFAREVGTGQRPVEMVMRRRFSVLEAFDARLTGRFSVDDNELAAPTSECGEQMLRLDGTDIPVRASLVDGRLDQSAFTSCAPVRLEAGWHTLDHSDDIAIDEVLILPTDLDIEALELPWPSRLETVAERMSGIEVTVPGVADGTEFSVLSGRATHPGWEASLADGTQLANTSLDAQAAFQVQPAPSAQIISIRFGPQRLYEASIAAMYTGLAFCIFLVLRRPATPREQVFHHD
jgi:O-antigen/teichoic acid export membrane protein